MWSAAAFCLSVVTTKIARSRHLGTCLIRKSNESVKVGEKLASVCLESSGTHLQTSQIVYFSWAIVATPIDRAHAMHMHLLSAHVHD